MDKQIDFDAKTNEELLFEYKSTGDQRIKQELTLRYVPLVKRVAIQMRNVYVGFSQIDDIINEGVITIMSSLDKFDPAQNVKFESYISKRIRGMVIDIARKQDWIPRGTRKIAKDIDIVTTQLYDQLGRPPTDQEIAEALNITLKKYYKEVQKIDLFNIISLDMVMDESSDKRWTGPLPEGADDMIPEKQYLSQEINHHLKQGLETLRENEQLVISLYYEQEFSIKEIAKVMGVSEPRISQIHGNALKKLRKHMDTF